MIPHFRMLPFRAPATWNRIYLFFHCYNLCMAYTKSIPPLGMSTKSCECLHYFPHRVCIIYSTCYIQICICRCMYCLSEAFRREKRCLSWILKGTREPNLTLCCVPFFDSVHFTYGVADIGWRLSSLFPSHLYLPLLPNPLRVAWMNAQFV